MIVWSPGITLENAEKLIIKRAISFYGSEEKAAYALQISMKEIQKRTKKYKEEGERLEEIAREEKRKNDDFVRRSRGLNGKAIAT